MDVITNHRLDRNHTGQIESLESRTIRGPFADHSRTI